MTHTLNGKTVLVVDVPEDAWFLVPENFKQDCFVSMGYLVYKSYNPKKKWLSLDALPGVKLPSFDYHEPMNKAIKLPAGDWHLLGKGDEVTEEEWKGLVERYGVNGYRNYMHESQYLEVLRKTATASGLSFLKSIGKEAEKTILLIENKI